MKKLATLFFVALFCTTAAMARDILYLKNGSVIKGDLVQAIPGDRIIFASIDGNSTFVYMTHEVLKVAKDYTQPSTQRNVISLKNGSVIKGYVSELSFDTDIKVSTDDGSIFVYNIQEIANVARDTTQPAVTQSTTQTSTTGQVINRHLAQKGYRGFVSFDPGYYVSGIGGIAFSTTHGYQFGHEAFIGGGVSFDVVDELFCPSFFAAFRGNVGKNVAQFTYGTRLGFQIVNDYVPFLWNFDLGLRIGISPNFGMHITPDFTLFAGSGFFDFRSGVRIGFEF